MPDLSDGESIEVQGSARQPYVLKNVAGVYSCSCPAWRNQSLAIDRRTCKHLRQLRGDAAEQERVGGDVPETLRKATAKPSAPPLLLAHVWENDVDLTGWWLSEKLDGVRAWWDGSGFRSRQGNPYHAPDWCTAGLPDVPLDGELWLDRKAFQRTVSIVRRQDGGEHWRQITFVVFDAPAVDALFETRQAFLQATFRDPKPQFARVLQQKRCRDVEHLRSELAGIESLGGEGLMLRQPGSRYETGRSSTLLKVKTFHDADARVVEHLPGRGRHKGRLGALLAELPNGTRFSVGTGFSDRQRECPPAVGSTITFRFQELTDGGVPRFPSFVRVRSDATEANGRSRSRAVHHNFHSSNHEEHNMPIRHYEYVVGNSAKFWDVSVQDCRVNVRFGRIGTAGQQLEKSFPDEAAANRHAEQLIASKIKKGYAEVATA